MVEIVDLNVVYTLVDFVNIFSESARLEHRSAHE